ncbi:MAG: glycerophosphodiester phosphodiesterase [Thermoplasmataceae archaeon]
MPLRYNGRDVFIIAHRGGGGLFPENSMAAFMGVQEIGVDAVECDVQLTKDGMLAVIHDADLKRLAGIDIQVREMDSMEIKKIRLKSGDKIPLLEELLDRITIPIVIELKSADTISSLFEMLEKNREMVRKCIFISFFHEALYGLRQKFPEASCGALLAGFPIDPVSMVKQCGCDTIALNYEGLTKDYVDRCHSGGIRVSVWAPSNIDGIRASLNSGVDAIASDRPDLVIDMAKSS